MPIELLNGFHYPTSQESAFDSEELTALQLAARTASKTNELTEKVNTNDTTLNTYITMMENVTELITNSSQILTDVETATSAANTAATSANAMVAANNARFLQYGINVHDAPWNILGDGSDETAKLQSLIDYLRAAPEGSRVVIFPAGTYAYTGALNWAMDGLRMVGIGRPTFKYLGTGTTAFLIDASPFTANWYQGMYISGIIIDGNGCANGMVRKHIVRSIFDDIEVRNVTTIGFQISASVSCINNRIACSQNLWNLGVMPTTGLQLDLTTTNDTFIMPLFEGIPSVGIRIYGADFNTFIGGASEGNGDYGVTVNIGCRTNMFIGVDFEVNTTDVSDAGIATQYINCNSQTKFTLSSQSKNIVIRGGLYNTVDIQGGADHPTVENILYNKSGTGTFTCSSKNARLVSIIDYTTYAPKYPAYGMSPVGARTNIVVGASPFTFTNAEEYPMLVNIYGGVVSTVKWKNATGDAWEIGGTASKGPVNGQFTVYPGDGLEITYTTAPQMNYTLR